VSNRYHHLDHAGQFFLGATLGLLLGSLPTISRRLGDHSTLGLATVLAAPTLMMLMMVPRIYERLSATPSSTRSTTSRWPPASGHRPRRGPGSASSPAG
jgi:hypothetical protein